MAPSASRSRKERKMVQPMNWPETSKHYINIWERLEAENPQLSYGNKCRKQYEESFGPYDGSYEGEIAWAQITN